MENVKTIDQLENIYKKLAKEQGEENLKWRLTESTCWYYIYLESSTGHYIYCVYITDNWDELVAFCRIHYNPGYALLDGLGNTQVELQTATSEYVHSLGKKTLYEN